MHLKKIWLLLPLLVASNLSMADTAQGAHHQDAGHAHGSDDASEYAAIGQPGMASQATRTLTIEMSDGMRFTPAEIQVKKNETVRFVVKNAGTLKHEMVLGTTAELKSHYALMLKNPQMEHADPNMITLPPGQTGEIIWTFSKAGIVDFACLQPGHFDAGMKGRVNVVGAPASQATHQH
ncbi:cupredoxin family protein [Aquabacterium sp.]|jgi:uncharacterized cupredoxin-like copper-binding protein|uniref:cupredoxin domain-containing protein n=1 Tax=Aquabacterium sp. TaxID=1872578 RepID=UPI0025BF4BB9|nr:cupredoxin family protein [Aquabacterium sp.]